MIDLTSSVYLGYDHPSRSLPPWPALTTGVPAAVRPTPGSQRLAGAVAALVGVPVARLARSCLHALVDAVRGDGPARTVLLDGGTYPLAGIAAATAARRGEVVVVPHFEPAAVRAALRGPRAGRRLGTPLLLVDGVCPGCGRLAPLAALAAEMHERAGIVVVDDTQGVGLLGTPCPGQPYGSGGGGSLRAAGTSLSAAAAREAVVVVASLAKAFGAPLAVTAGTASALGALGGSRVTELHSSQPTVVDIAAARSALDRSARSGDAARRRLGCLVARMGTGLRQLGTRPRGDLLPVVQALDVEGRRAVAVQRGLLRCGVHSLVAAGGCRHRPVLTFLLTARLRPEEIDGALATLAAVLAAHPQEAWT